jgi:molecular chaperone GrpE
MARMPQHDRGTGIPHNREGAEDIEILEVIGVDEDGAPLVADGPEDVEVVFDEAPADSAPIPLDPPAAPPAESDMLRERMLRLQADFENFKKRAERERLEHVRYASHGVVARILPVLDNFERAMASARLASAGDALLEGLALIQRQLVSELEAEGLRPMESVGERFDPARHEAVATDPDSPMPPHTVTEVFQRGYFLHERVLRPALVRVSIEESDGESAADDRKES